METNQEETFNGNGSSLPFSIKFPLHIFTLSAKFKFFHSFLEITLKIFSNFP